MHEAIRNRQTLKVLADPENPWPAPSAAFDNTLLELLELAACGPYHYPCDPVHQTGTLDSPAPWRFYAMNGAQARMLLTRISTFGIPLGNVGRMLAAADGLVVATWLPDPASSEAATHEMQTYDATHRNMEHIAAAAAAIQNLLLAATGKGIHNYWSSGGSVPRGEAFYELLGIPKNQVLLGTIFLFPEDVQSADTKPGKNRRAHGERERWMKWITLDD